jgi:dienelactone hydrolase
MLMHGMCAEDYIKLMDRTERNMRTFEPVMEPEDFVDVAHELGDADAVYAEKELALGHKVTAAQYYLQASALYRVADYGLVAFTDEKRTLTRKMVDCFRRGKELEEKDNPEYVEIPFGGSIMPAYLTIPSNAPADVPVVIVISGATGFKEENYGMAYKLWERGIASITFDGPGQGEALLFHNCYYTLDNYEKAVHAVINHLREKKGLSGPIGAIGISYGGYLATRAACFNNEDISALAVRGGCTRSDNLILARNFIYMPNFMNKCNVGDQKSMIGLSHQMDIEDYVDAIKCPLLVVHTQKDYSVGVEGARYIYEHVSSSDKEYVEMPGDLHCADNEDMRVGSYIADWFSSRLLKREEA